MEPTNVELNALTDLERRSGISKHTWRSWIRQRRIPHMRLGRRVLVAEEDFLRFQQSNRVEAK